MPILPRHERGNRILRYLVAVVLLIAIVGGSAFAVTRYLDRDDGAGQTETAQTIPSTDPANAEGEGGGSGLATPEADEEGSAADEAAEPASTPTETVEETTEETVVDETDEVTPTPEGAVLAQQTGDDEPAQQGDQAAEGETGAASNDGPVGAAGYLPEATDLGEGWSVQDEGERTREDVAVQLGDDGDALLTSWRWRENPYRNLIRGNAANFPSEATFVSVSAHRFASQEGAAEALQYLADIVVTGQGLQDVEMEPIGDESRGLFGPSDGANLYVLYVRDGNYVIRLGGSSATGDPSELVDAVAQQLVAAN
jgi:hypothetical protein